MQKPLDPVGEARTNHVEGSHRAALSAERGLVMSLRSRARRYRMTFGEDGGE